MRIILLSDIHANLTALQAILDDIQDIGSFDSYVVLGDLVNYGPRPNEVIDLIDQLSPKIIINLWGNHEYSIFGGSLDRFSTDRGRAVLRYTNTLLTEKSRTYLDSQMSHSGYEECIIEGKKFLFIHGNLDDPYWGKFGIDKMNDERYAEFDYVISGHSHIPFYVEQFFFSDNRKYRNKKRTIFVNPGSVGQPRNHNPFAQYGILDTLTGNYEHRSVRYDVIAEQAFFDDSINVFYKERLILGI